MPPSSCSGDHAVVLLPEKNSNALQNLMKQVWGELVKFYSQNQNTRAEAQVKVLHTSVDINAHSQVMRGRYPLNSSRPEPQSGIIITEHLNLMN